MSFSRPFDVQVAHRVDEIGPATWDHLGAGRPFASYRWYCFGERVLADMLPVYIILSQAGEPVARGTFWLHRREPLPVSSKPVRRLIEALMRRWPLLVCRSPVISVPGVILPETPLRDAALKTIIQVAQEQAHLHQASFVIFDYLEQAETRWAGWPEGFNTVQLSKPGTRLPIAWPDFESYLDCLPKSARKDYRRKCNRAANLGLVVTAHEKITHSDEAMVLIRNVEQRHHTSPNPWVKAILEHASLVDATWLTAQIDQRLVGCGLLFSEAGTGVATLLGLDYELQYVYFQILYSAIRAAIEKGLRVLRGGSGSYEVKQQLGFQLEDNGYVAFAGNNRMVHRLGRWLSGSRH